MLTTQIMYQFTDIPYEAAVVVSISVNSSSIKWVTYNYSKEGSMPPAIVEGTLYIDVNTPSLQKAWNEKRLDDELKKQTAAVALTSLNLFNKFPSIIKIIKAINNVKFQK